MIVDSRFNMVYAIQSNFYIFSKNYVIETAARPLPYDRNRIKNMCKLLHIFQLNRTQKHKH